MSSLPLLDKLDLVIRALRRLNQELARMPPEQRQLVLDLSWPQVPSFAALREDLIRWADRLGQAEPDRAPVPEAEQPLHALAACVRKSRRALSALTGSIGSSSEATAQMGHRIARVRGALQQASWDVEVLRWLGPTLSNELPFVDRLLLQERPLAALVGSVAAPLGLTGEVRLDIPAFLLLRAAPGALETVLSHLLDNAAVHAPGAAVHVHARVGNGSERPGLQAIPFIMLTVADTGPGIPDGEQPQLFEQRLRGEGRARHLACGLWLCRRILDAHGGDLWLDRTDAGASFTAAWPLSAQRFDLRHTARSTRWPADPHRFGQALRYTREQSGLPRVELAKLAGVADSTIRNVETSRVRPRRPTRGRLIAALESHRQTSGPADGFFEHSPADRTKPGSAPGKAD